MSRALAILPCIALLSFHDAAIVPGGIQNAVSPLAMLSNMDLQEPPKREATRSARLLFSSASTPILELMRQTPANAYFQVGTRDLFDFLRDTYLLPRGVYAPYKVYDYVVVGAGAAGCVLASRLSEDGRYSVLLLEAGGAESVISDVPLMAAYLQSTDYNWGYRMERQSGVCLGMEDQRCNWPRGKAIGGTSVINYMIYTRGNRVDWDRVAAAGNPGWSYDEVLPYFLKSERANLQGLENSSYHNTRGLMSVEYIRYKTPLLDAFLEAGQQLGHKIVDYNQDTNGFSRVQAQTQYGRRHSAARAFLYPFRSRSNLHILPHSRVTKINISKKSMTARSVEFVHNRYRYRVRAKKEIIISAGALNSPQILMLSGIGPKAHLHELGIPLIKDLPVGENMYDHLSFVGLPFLVNTSGDTIVETEVLNVANAVNWLKRGEGPYTLIGGVEGLGYIKTNISDEQGDYPDMELIFLAAGITADGSGAVRKGMKISSEFFDEVYKDIVEKPCWNIIPMILHPKSKGYIKLKDSNPFHWPKFYYDYFSDKRDLDTFVEAIKYIIKLSETPAFKKYGSVMHRKHFPTCADHVFGTDAYWACAVRTLSATLHHQIGTCKMGPVTDPESVVDHELRVHGIKRLRVADTSIIPKPLTAHTNAPAIMIGEKLADILKKEWH